MCCARDIGYVRLGEVEVPDINKSGSELWTKGKERVPVSYKYASGPDATKI